MSPALAPAAVDIYVCPEDHKHAETSTCHASHGCRCTPCKQAHVEYSYWWRHMNAAGRPLNSDVDARGTRRRLQALAAIGWSATAIGALLGIHQTGVSRWLIRDRVTRATHDAIAELYERISLTPPPADTYGQRLSVAKTIAFARRHDFALPLEWDDIDNDDEPSRPEPTAEHDVVAIQLAVKDGARVPLTQGERREGVRQLHAQHHSDRIIADMLGCSEKTVFLDRQALDLPAAVDAGRNPIIRKLAA